MYHRDFMIVISCNIHPQASSLSFSILFTFSDQLLPGVFVDKAVQNSKKQRKSQIEAWKTGTGSFRPDATSCTSTRCTNPSRHSITMRLSLRLMNHIWVGGSSHFHMYLLILELGDVWYGFICTAPFSSTMT